MKPKFNAHCWANSSSSHCRCRPNLSIVTGLVRPELAAFPQPGPRFNQRHNIIFGRNNKAIVSLSVYSAKNVITYCNNWLNSNFCPNQLAFIWEMERRETCSAPNLSFSLPLPINTTCYANFDIISQVYDEWHYNFVDNDSQITLTVFCVWIIFYSQKHVGEHFVAIIIWHPQTALTQERGEYGRIRDCEQLKILRR